MGGGSVQIELPLFHSTLVRFNFITSILFLLADCISFRSDGGASSGIAAVEA